MAGWAESTFLDAEPSTATNVRLDKKLPIHKLEKCCPHFHNSMSHRPARKINQIQYNNHDARLHFLRYWLPHWMTRLTPGPAIDLWRTSFQAPHTEMNHALVSRAEAPSCTAYRKVSLLSKTDSRVDLIDSSWRRHTQQYWP